MVIKFCANLNFLFVENGVHILDRFRLAKKAGFRAVENSFPNDVTIEQAASIQKETGLDVVLLNICLGTSPDSGFGCAALPQKEQEFQQNLQRTIEFAKVLNCKKIHLMAGKINGGITTPENDSTYFKNIQYATKILETENIIGVIEPICSYGVPGYYLNNFKQAIDVIDKIKSPNLKLMVDLFHLQHTIGNITNSFKDLKNYIGHVQIAQVPGRNEPNTSGEINYKYVLKTIEDAGYNDWIGCEYKPKTNTIDGLDWIKEFGYSY